MSWHQPSWRLTGLDLPEKRPSRHLTLGTFSPDRKEGVR